MRRRVEDHLVVKTGSWRGVLAKSLSVGIVLSLVAPLVASLGSLLQDHQRVGFPGRGPRRVGHARERAARSWATWLGHVRVAVGRAYGMSFLFPIELVLVIN
jgi:hypothetical protein